MESLINLLKSLFEPVGVLLAIVLLLLLNTWIFRKIKSNGSGSSITRNTISFFLVLFGTLIFIL